MARATSKSFVLNLWLPHEESDETRPDEEAFGHYLDVLRPYVEELKIDLPTRPAAYLPPFDEHIAAALEARPAVLLSSSSVSRPHRASMPRGGWASSQLARPRPSIKRFPSVMQRGRHRR